MTIAKRYISLSPLPILAVVGGQHSAIPGHQCGRSSASFPSGSHPKNLLLFNFGSPLCNQRDFQEVLEWWSFVERGAGGQSGIIQEAIKYVCIFICLLKIL